MGQGRPHFDLRRAIARLGFSFSVGLLVAVAVSTRLPLVAAGLVGWDVASLVLLTLSWTVIAKADARFTRNRAGSEDPGRTLVYVVVLITSAASLLAGTILVREARTLPPVVSHALAALCLSAVALPWATTHTAFAFRSALLSYREDAEGVGGVPLPGRPRPTS